MLAQRLTGRFEYNRAIVNVSSLFSLPDCCEKGSILRAFYYYSSLKKHFELHLMYLGSLCRCLSIVLYLKGSQSQLDVQSGCHSSALRQECKHGVVHPKQRDEEQSGFSQPSEGNHSQRNKEENIA